MEEVTLVLYNQDLQVERSTSENKLVWYVYNRLKRVWLPNKGEVCVHFQLMADDQTYSYGCI